MLTTRGREQHQTSDQSREQPDPPAHIQLDKTDSGSWRLICSGNWTAELLDDAVAILKRQVGRLRNAGVHWDFSAVGQMDSAGMMLYLHYRRVLERQGCRVETSGQGEAQRQLFELLKGFLSEQPPTRSLGQRLLNPLHEVGRTTVNGWRDLREFLAFLGENFIVLVRSLMHPSSIRIDAISKNIEQSGIRALPIITLTSFLIGVVIAYQGAVQLQKFGANIFIVDMIGISVTRELAPLITAIVVAGRTGSSYTAQLGVMKITEEIDAMRVMGFEPHQFLVLPRIIALMIALPLLVFFADIVGIFGGMVVANLHLNLSWSEFIHRLQNVVEVKHFWIGIIKAPFFAWLIATVGCFRGLQVSRDTESIGRYTTISVVNAIFLVIACDAIFSVVLTELEI
ncbi:MAG TPA: MlaE family lipid ABC transporter permease subunit [Chromatiaceae bacterium]|nr:MlaE family lipid ABC transporter permease subunit [Chromatiaceae bacterium]